MPLYDYKCFDCDRVQEEFRSYQQRYEGPACTCGEPMNMVFLPPRVMRDIAEYTSPIDGSRITTRSQHRDHMKRHGVIEMGDEKPKPHQRSIPMDSIRQEMRSRVQRMKSEGTLRER